MNIRLDCSFLRDLFQRFINGVWGRRHTTDVLQCRWVAGHLNSSLLVLPWGSCSPWFLIKWYNTDDRFWSALLHLVPSWSKDNRGGCLLESTSPRWGCLQTAWLDACFVWPWGSSWWDVSGAAEPGSHRMQVTAYTLEKSWGEPRRRLKL